MNKVKFVVLVSLILSILLMTGCWNYREIETLSIVAGLSVDRGGSGSGYHLTFDTVDVTGGKENSSKSKLIESDGSTIYDAVRNTIKKSDKQVYFGDCKVIVISEQIARDGLAPVLDWLNRDHELRNDLNLCISREKTAQDVLNLKGLTNQIASIETDKIVVNNSKYLSKAPRVKLFEAGNMLSGKGISLVLPVLHITGNMGDQAAELDGTALFKGDKLIGYLDCDESKLFLFATDKVKGGLFNVKQDSQTPDISLEIKSSKTNITTLCMGEAPQIKIDIKMQCIIDEIQTTTDYGTADGVKEIECSAAKQIEDGIKQLISDVQAQYDSDIFGFGNTLNQNNAKCWKNMQSNWDSIFKTLKVEVTAKVEIQDIGTTIKKPKVGE